MARETKEELLKLLHDVEKLSEAGKSQKDITSMLGFKSPFTLNNRLIRASQITGKPVPPFKRTKGARRKTVGTVSVKRRGKGEAFGVNIPQEPLTRLGLKPGDTLQVTVRRKQIVLSLPE